jgi:stage II sporulation protein AA (anti-sigma F factor antagonist)
MRMENKDDELTVYLDGELDHHAAKGIREEIDDAINRLGPKELVLDFKDVTFMDSSGIGLVMGRYRAMELGGGTLSVRGTSPQIRKVMKLAGLDRLASFE